MRRQARQQRYVTRELTQKHASASNNHISVSVAKGLGRPSCSGHHLPACSEELALDAIRSASKPVIAIKPMAGGRFLGEQAFDYVFNEVGVSASMFGMGTIAQVRETIQTARRVLCAAA